MPDQGSTRQFQVLNISKGDFDRVLKAVGTVPGIVGRAEGGSLDGTQCSLTKDHDFHCGDSKTD